MIASKITVALGSVIAVLVGALMYCGYIISSTYKELAIEQTKAEACLASMSELNSAIDEANERIEKLSIEAKNYKYSKNRLQEEVNKVYEQFNKATSCTGIVNNIDNTFKVMHERLQEMYNDIEIQEVSAQWMRYIDSKPDHYILTGNKYSNQTPYLN